MATTVIDCDLGFVSGGILACSTTAQRVTDASGAGYLTVANDTLITVYVGTSGVTSAGANGIAILPGATRTARYAELSTIYIVAASGTPNVSRCVER